MGALRRWVKRALAALGVLALVAIAVILFLVETNSGTRIVLSRAVERAGPWVRYEGVEGNLGGPMRIASIEIEQPGLYVRIEGLELETALAAALGGRLRVHRLSAASVEVRMVASDAPLALPPSLAPPFAVRLEQASVGELRVGTLTREAATEKDRAKKRALMDAARASDLVVKDIGLRGEGDERAWSVEEARAETVYGKATVSGSIEVRAPFALAVKANASGEAAGRAWRAEASARGTLEAIDATLAADMAGQRANAQGRIEPFARQPLRAVQASAKDLDLARLFAAPRTRLDVDLKLEAESKGFAGPVRIANADAGPWDRERLPIASLAARMRVGADRLELEEVALGVPGGGSATGRAALGRSGAHADLAVVDVDLASLYSSLQKTRITGRLGVSGDTASQRFDVVLRDPRFEVEGRATLAARRLDVEAATVRAKGGEVTAAGSVAFSGHEEFRVEGKARGFDPAVFVKTEPGELNFVFSAAGTLAPPAGEGKVEIAPSQWAGLPLAGRIAASGERDRVASLDLDVTLADAHATARGSLGRAGDAMDIAINAPDLAKVAKPFGIALGGKAQAEAHVAGTFQSLAGRVALNATNVALPSHVSVRELTARLEAGLDAASPIDAAIDAKGIAIGGEPQSGMAAQGVSASLKGTRAEHRLEVTAALPRDVNVRARVAGGIDPNAKVIAWSGRLESLTSTGPGALALAAPASLEASAERVELGDATVRGEWGELRFERTRWTPQTLDLKGGSTGIQVANLVRSLRITNAPRSNIVLAVDWDVRAGESVEGSVNVRRISGDVRLGEPALGMGLTTLELKADLAGGRAHATLDAAGERIGRISGEATGRVAHRGKGFGLAPDAPLAARIEAEHANLASLAPWLGQDAKLGGSVNATVSVEGTAADPRVSGTARASNLQVREPQSGFEIERGAIALRLAGKSLAIEQFDAVTPWRMPEGAHERVRRTKAPEGGGTIHAEGGIDLGARTGAIRLKFDHVVVTSLPTRFLSVSGETRLEAGAKELLVTGALEADAGWVGALATPLPSAADDIVVVRKAQAAAEEAPREPIRIDMKLSAGERLHLQGRGLDTRLAGEIRLTGAPGPGLRASGAIRTVSGTYEGYGQKLSIDRGVLTFQGPLDNPRLNVLALRKGLPVEAGLEILGTTSRPRVRLVSIPDVPESEKLSWLVLGRGASDASTGDSALMVAAAQALMGQNNPSKDITKRLGIDEVSIGRAQSGTLGVLPQTTVAGRTGSGSATEVVTVGTHLSRDLRLSYEQGLSDAEGSIKVAWQVTRQFAMLVRAGYLPGVDAVYKWTIQ